VWLFESQRKKEAVQSTSDNGQAKKSQPVKVGFLSLVVAADLGSIPFS
jgi:hypothetical protein